ncbi:MAG TPA: SIMPL domain-containing protein [Candidatus Limnocylindrales bacterium]
MPPKTVTLTLPDSRARWIAGGIAIGALAAALAGPLLASHSVLAADPATPPEHTISVSGTGRIVVSPDIADLRLGVSVSKPTVRAAREAAAESMNRMLAALKALGIADKDIQTTTLSLQPNYDYSNNNPPRLIGYTLSNGVAVTIRNLDKIGDAIDNSLAAGATTLDGVSFRVEDPAKAEEQARAEAMSQAKAKAQTLASGGGVSIVGVASISESAAPMPYPQMYSGAFGAAKDASAPTPVQVGTNEVVVTVQVAYLIK